MCNKKRPTEVVYKNDLFAFLIILSVPVFTLILGTKKSPYEHTLSSIGSMPEYNTAFIVWGAVTGIFIVIYELYIFEKLDYKNKKAKICSIISGILLFLTVITPSNKTTQFINNLHVVFSVLFPILLTASIMMFIRYMKLRNRRLGNLAFILLLITIAIPSSLLFIMRLNGIVEILFFVLISVFLVVLNVIADSVEIKMPINTFRRRLNSPNYIYQSNIN